MKSYILRFIGVTIIVIAFEGCAKIGSYYYINPITDNNLSKVKLLRDNLSNVKIIEPACDDTNSTFKDDETNRTCIYQRNAALTTLIIASDEMCMEHISTIVGNEAATNFSLGTLTTLFAGASTLATVNTSKSILAGLATFSSAERSLINDTIYKSILAPVIIKKISDTRLEKRKSLLKRMEDENITKFSLNFGLMDFMDYHNSCSLLFGLQKALQEGTQDGTKIKKQALEEQLMVLRAQRDNRERQLKDMNSTKYNIVGSMKEDSDYNATNERIEAINKTLIGIDSLISTK